jgi:signal transduction histidine kinase
MKKLMQFWQNQRLALKFAVVTSIVVLTAVLVLTFLLMDRERTSFRNDLEDDADLLLNTLALTIREPLNNLERNELAAVVEVVLANDNVTQVRIYSDSGLVLAEAPEREVLFRPSNEPLVYDILGGSGPDITHEWGDDELVSGRISQVGNQKLGVIVIGLSTQPLDERIASFQRYSVGTAIVIVLLGAAFTYLFTRQITRPLQSLTQAAQKMSKGDLTAHVKQTSEDEIGQLGSVFNEMSAVVSSRDKALQDANVQLEQRIEEVNQARAEAEQANTVKSQFLASVSHELRTPLNSIINFTEFVLTGRMGEVNEKQEKALSNVIESGEDLLRLINDVLDISKIEAGALRLFVEEEVDLREKIERSIEVGKSLLGEKSVELELDMADDLPKLTCDAHRINQIILNLISNACKFTREGKIVVQAKKEDGSVVLMVRDTGPGIAKEDFEKVFEVFTQTEGGIREGAGTGLGLPISKRLAEAHGGRLWLDSEVGKGTTFYVSLPVKSHLEPTL